MEKSQNHNKHHIQEPRGQPFPSRWPQGSNGRRKSMKNTRHKKNTNDPQKKYSLGIVSKNILLEGLNRFHGAPTTPLVQMWINTHRYLVFMKVSKDAKIRNRYNQVPHLTQDINGKVTNSQLDTTNKSQKVSTFPAGDHKAHINRRIQMHSKHKTEKKHKRSTKEVPPWNGR